MLLQFYVQDVGSILTKKNFYPYKNWEDLATNIVENLPVDFECCGDNLEEFFRDELEFLDWELEPHNRKLIKRFYNDQKCETIYLNLLEKYYGDNATGETYVYEPPVLPDIKKPRKKFLGIF